MSTHTEQSAWSPDEADSLENIDKEIQLVSTSTESHSTSKQTGNGSSHKKIISDSSLKLEVAPRQSTVNISHSKSYDNLEAIKFHSSNYSCIQEKNFSSKFHENKNAGDSINHHSNENTGSQVYDHLQSKPKLSNSDSVKLKGTTKKSTEISNKEDYLEQVNKQLTKELDEKNAILSILQENYEHLLFKYAEAQNRIDELRIKFLAEKPEPKSFQMKQENLSCHTVTFLNEEYSGRGGMKFQKGSVTPVINLDEPRSPPSINSFSHVTRPSSLPLDNGLKFGERDLLKATTPTDSEGLSSIITSMSGHSKILNSLDEENQINKKSNLFKYKRNHFLLQENAVPNDPFDKVKNWQNSLPPLEQIETPETTLYNINNAYSSTDTKYKEISSPKTEKNYVFSDESCPLSWREETHIYNGRYEVKRSKVSSKVNETQFYLKKQHPNAVDEGDHFHEGSIPLKEKSPTHSNIPSTCIIQRRQKRPPLLRCSSLPAYDYDCTKSENCKNGIYIPPLDLNSVTLSDDESYCQQDYYVNKSDAPTSSSFVSSREDSNERPIQTPQSFSSCKTTISEERVPRQTMSKSTSITPERTKAMDSFTNPDRNKFDANSVQECKECCSSQSVNRCNVCGESISEYKSDRFFGSRSNSCESVHKRESSLKETSGRRSKPPFKRSVSFGSGTNTPGYCPHEKQTPRQYFSGLNEDSVENFDAYANSLRARSQVAIKALTAHVNNS